MIVKDLKELCENNKRFENLSKEHKKQYKKELYRAKIAYDNDIDLLSEFENNKDKLQTNYVLPYLLNYTDEITNEELEFIQVKPGASGGIDVDSDFESASRDKIISYLKNKYGEECVLYVGTYSKLGLASAAKDLLRVYNIDFGKSNEFTTSLDAELSWEENINNFKATNRKLFEFYSNNKQILDLVPEFLNKVRNLGKHAGGVVILPKPVYNYIPVNRVKNELTTGFCESGSDSSLDDLGIVKFDLLSISILDVMSKSIDMINEKLYLIEDDDGIKKVVGESYLK